MYMQPISSNEAEHGYDVITDESRNRQHTDKTQKDERPKGWSKKSFVLGCFSGFGMGSVITAILVTFILLIVLRQDKNTKADKSDCFCRIAPAVNNGAFCTTNRTFRVYTSLSQQETVSDDYCPVSVCNGNNKWRDFSISTSKTECYKLDENGGSIYNGKNTCTKTGRTCQAWNLDYPHRRNSKHIPKNEADLSSNYCRNPGPPYERIPWCYTTDPNVRFELCHIPECR